MKKTVFFTPTTTCSLLSCWAQSQPHCQKKMARQFIVVPSLSTVTVLMLGKGDKKSSNHALVFINLDIFGKCQICRLQSWTALASGILNLMSIIFYIYDIWYLVLKIALDSLASCGDNHKAQFNWTFFVVVVVLWLSSEIHIFRMEFLMPPISVQSHYLRLVFVGQPL